MANNNMRNPVVLANMVAQLQGGLQRQLALNDAAAGEIIRLKHELEKLGATFILAVRRAGGRLEIPDEEVVAIAASTRLNVQPPDGERNSWLISVVEVAPAQDTPPTDTGLEEVAPGITAALEPGENTKALAAAEALEDDGKGPRVVVVPAFPSEEPEAPVIPL